MAYSETNPVTIGNPTKKSDYDMLWDNVDAIKAEVEVEHDSDGTHKASSLPVFREYFFMSNF